MGQPAETREAAGQSGSPASPEPALGLPRLFRDGLVLQREQANVLHGRAGAGVALELRLAGWSGKTLADARGRWSATLPALPAGGPHVLDIAASNGETLQVRDLYLGDVWLCSGQSNIMTPMERLLDRFPEDLAQTDYPLIRQFTVPEAYDFDGPRTDLAGGDWVASAPQTVAGFSAVAWYFARDLHRRLGIAVGLIQCAVGGSPIQSWLSQPALAAWPQHLAAATRYRDPELVRQTEAADNARAGTWRADLDARDAGLAGNWQQPELDDAGWTQMTVPGLWADGPLGPVNGVVWFRREFQLDSRLAGQAAVLDLGRIVDADTVFVNGTHAGSTGYQYPPRRYVLPAGLLRPGRNVITVRVVNEGGQGGFVTGKPCRLSFGLPATCAEAGRRQAAAPAPVEVLELGGSWKCRLGAAATPLGPSVFIRWQPSGLYNAMLAPLMQYRVKGVIWYQGESNTGNPAEYPALLRTLVESWRAGWCQADLPFLLVQLPLFNPPAGGLAAGPAGTAPAWCGDSGWPALRQAQLEALAIPRTGLAVTLDLGEWNDIHPVDKRELGTRLALQARRLVHGESGLLADGPLADSASNRAGKVLVWFREPAVRPVVGPAMDPAGCPGQVAGLAGFELAGADGVFRAAQAAIRDAGVEVWCDQLPEPKQVRYAWADNPACANLWGNNGLPASPFCLVVR